MYNIKRNPDKIYPTIKSLNCEFFDENDNRYARKQAENRIK